MCLARLFCPPAADSFLFTHSHTLPPKTTRAFGARMMLLKRANSTS
jgi:hypothetical protein